MAASSGSKSGSGLDDFLHKLLSKKPSYSSIFIDSTSVPNWAVTCPNLLYSAKSVPAVFSEANKLYLCYEGSPSSVGLVGETENKKPIKRLLNIETKGSTIIVSSKHKNMSDNNFVTFKGKGCSFQAAIDDYFLKSDLRTADYKFTMNNVQTEGDAFVLQKAKSEKGQSFLVKKTIEAVKKIFALVPEEQHNGIFLMIEKNLKNINDYLGAQDLKKIASQYDTRLWIIVESICRQFDHQELEEGRKPHRDNLIAECCCNLMKGTDIASRLEAYVEILKMHKEIMAAQSRMDLPDKQKELVNDYKKQNFIPEVDREKIRDYFQRYSMVEYHAPQLKS